MYALALMKGFIEDAVHVPLIVCMSPRQRQGTFVANKIVVNARLFYGLPVGLMNPFFGAVGRYYHQGYLLVIGLGNSRGIIEGSRATGADQGRSEEHTSELQSRPHLVCRLLLEKKKDLLGYAGQSCAMHSE